MGWFVNFGSQLIRSIDYGVFVRLSSLVSYPGKFMSSLFRAWQGELKYSAPRFVRNRR
jgi:hypothetical protein